jgi:hypothetical protein
MAGTWLRKGTTPKLGLPITYVRQGNINDLSVKARLEVDYGVGALNPEMIGMQLQKSRLVQLNTGRRKGALSGPRPHGNVRQGFGSAMSVAQKSLNQCAIQVQKQDVE